MGTKQKTKTTLNFIDVFSGAGGLSCGLEMAGCKCLLAIDHDKHAISTFQHNHSESETFCGDIKKLNNDMLLKLLKGRKVHAVVGGPPCQGFSTVGPGDPKDIRNRLFMEFVRIVKVTRPYYILIENVTGILAKKNEKTLKAIFEHFKILGHTLNIQVLSAQNFGVPERRKRAIILGSSINQECIFPTPSYDTTIDGVYIPPVTVGKAFSGLAKKVKKGLLNHDLDEAQVKSEMDKKRLLKIPEGKGIRYEEDEKRYLPKRIRLGVDWQKIPEQRLRQTKYHKLHRKSPGPTIMTNRHSYYHPTEPRYLTQREAATLQSFPHKFLFKGPISAQWRQIGNAVPPLVGKALGKCILTMYQNAQENNKKGISKRNIIVNDFKDLRGKAFKY